MAHREFWGKWPERELNRETGATIRGLPSEEVKTPVLDLPASRCDRLTDTSVSKPEEMSRKWPSLYFFLYRDILQTRKRRVGKAKYLDQVPDPGWNPGALPFIRQHVLSSSQHLLRAQQTIKITTAPLLESHFPQTLHQRWLFPHNSSLSSKATSLGRPSLTMLSALALSSPSIPPAWSSSQHEPLFSFINLFLFGFSFRK